MLLPTLYRSIRF